MEPRRYSLDAPLDLAGTELVDASALARMLGVSREWVYDHARELGALRLGSGRRPRLRFDPRVVAAALADGFGVAHPSRRANRFWRAAPRAGDIELLPIGGVRSKGAPKRTT